MLSGVRQEHAYQVVKELSAQGYTVSAVCRVLSLGRSSYYQWLNRRKSRRQEENERILQTLSAIYLRHEGTYGYRRLGDEYNALHGTHYNEKRFYRLTQLAGLKSIIRRKRPAYRRSKPEFTAENLLNREFSALRPNEKWLTDVTEMKYGHDKKLYLSAIMDLKSRDIVAYAVSRANNNDLVLSTFDSAFRRYPDARPLLHSDRGFQYTSHAFRDLLCDRGMTHSMSRVGKCIDNGPMEGFWGILKCEMYHLRRFRSYDELAAAIARFIHYYNHIRRQRALCSLPPAGFRQQLERVS